MKRKIMIVIMLVILVMVTGCSGKGDTFTYKGLEEDWSIELPKTLKKDGEDKNDQLKMSLVMFRDEKGRILNIGEIQDPAIEVNEEALQAEIEQDSFLHVERTETIDVKGVGKIYGALIEDKSTARAMLYYKIKLEDKVLAFMLYQKNPFTLEEEAQIKAMMSTFKKLK